MKIRRAWVVAFSLGLALGCSRAAPKEVLASGERSAAATAVEAQREGTIFHLEGRQGASGAPWVEASYKIRREAGRLSKTLAIDVEQAPPGVSHALSLDGFALGKLITGVKGKGEFELTAAGEDYFPDGFVEPKEGSVVRVGELAELHLQAVHKLEDLQVDIAGPGKLAGKIGFKVERLGDTVTTEFQVKVTQAGEKSVHPVTIDGVHVGDLEVDLGGKGKLLYSTLRGEPFPSGFPEPKADSTIAVGTLFQGQLRDHLAPASE